MHESRLGERGESSIPRHETKPKEAYGHGNGGKNHWSLRIIILIGHKKWAHNFLAQKKMPALVHTQKANQEKLDASKESKVKKHIHLSNKRSNLLYSVVKRPPPDERKELHAYPLPLADSDPEGDSRCSGSGITTPLRYVTCQSIVRGQQVKFTTTYWVTLTQQRVLVGNGNATPLKWLGWEAWEQEEREFRTRPFAGVAKT